MKSTEFITEIERLKAYDYTGGKNSLHAVMPGTVYKPLPGGSGLLYGISKDGYTVYISDPNVEHEPFNMPVRFRGDTDRYYQRIVAAQKERWKAKVANPVTIGELDMGPVKYIPLKNAVQVNTITVDEDYRGMGIAKALYGVVLTIMKKTLVSGSSQTPGGRRNWMSLASIPGVEVKGLVRIPDDAFGKTEPIPNNADKWQRNWAAQADKKADETINMIMNLGGDYVGEYDGTRYFAFDVVPGKGELAPAVKNKLSGIYGGNADFRTILFARWVG